MSAPAPRQADFADVDQRVSTIQTSEPLVSNGRLGGVSVDEAGNVYVANFSATVYRVSPAGVVTVMATGLRGSSGNDKNQNRDRMARDADADARRAPVGTSGTADDDGRLPANIFQR